MSYRSTNEEYISKSWPDFQQESSDFNSFMSQHRLVNTEFDKQKLCFYCQKNKLRTKSGYNVLTRHMCETCQVPLCRGKYTERSCFYLYHTHIFQNTPGFNT